MRKVRAGEGAFSGDAHGSEDSRKWHTNGTKQGIPEGSRGHLKDAHGFGHEGKSEIKGAMRLSGDKRAHRVGARKK